MAQRFNAGIADEHRRVSKGRLDGRARLGPVSRPVGIYGVWATFPALKRRAIIGSPSGKTLQSTRI